MELTTTTLGRRRSGPPSVRATLFLAFSTFLLGCVVASLLFVGIWRRTADDAARTRAAEAQTRSVQQHDRQQLTATQASLSALHAQLAQSKRLLSAARGRLAATTKALERERAVTRAVAPRLQVLADGAASLARQTATIQSELSALEAYAQHPGAAGLDGGYLATQAQYVGRQAASVASAATTLTQQARDAQAAAGTTAP